MIYTLCCNECDFTSQYICYCDTSVSHLLSMTYCSRCDIDEKRQSHKVWTIYKADMRPVEELRLKQLLEIDKLIKSIERKIDM